MTKQTVSLFWTHRKNHTDADSFVKCRDLMNIDQNIQIERNEYGKPYFVDSPWHFNISHTDTIWACVFSTSPIGLDIEEISNKDTSLIVRRFFHPLEKQYLDTSP